jgi:hypothetical protein
MSASMAAAQLLRQCGVDEPVEMAVLLGTGLGALAGALDGPVTVSYQDLPGFPEMTVPGHAGQRRERYNYAESMATAAPQAIRMPKVRIASRCWVIAASRSCHAQQLAEPLQLAPIGISQGAGIAAFELADAAPDVGLQARAEVDGRRQFYERLVNNHDGRARGVLPGR